MKRILRNTLAASVIGCVIALYILIVYLTSKVVHIHSKPLSGRALGKIPIWVFWHNRLSLSPFFQDALKQRMHALFSPHQDGALIAKTMRVFGVMPIWGSSNKNPVSAMKSVLTLIRKGKNVVIIPDGPRGPAHQINSGICKLALAEKAAIRVCGWEAKRVIRFKSWDRFVLPLPFNSIVFAYDVLEDFCLSEAEMKLLLKSKLDRVVELSSQELNR